jgi:hypothetical protein
MVWRGLIFIGTIACSQSNEIADSGPDGVAADVETDMGADGGLDLPLQQDLQFWYATDSVVVDDNGQVLQWHDKSPKGNDLGRIDLARAPDYAVDALGPGRDAVRFEMNDGLSFKNDPFDSASGVMLNKYSFFIVYTPKAIEVNRGALFWVWAAADFTCNGQVFSIGPGGATWGISNTGLACQSYWNAIATGVEANRTNVFSVSGQFPGGAVNTYVELFVDDQRVLKQDLLPAATVSHSKRYFGTRNSGNAFWPSDPDHATATGAYSEVIAYNRSLTTEEHASVRAYLIKKWK